MITPVTNEAGTTVRRLNVHDETLTPLQEYVRHSINRYTEGYKDTGVKGYLDDLMTGGCESGIVSELIYYTDTVKFYKKYKAEIKELLKDAMANSGVTSCAELFGDKWDDSDPFCEEDNNQNLLAWFGYEETAYLLAGRAKIEL